MPASPTTSEYLSVRALLESVYPVSRRTLIRRMNQRVDPIPYIRDEGRVLFKTADVEAWLERRAVK